MLEFKASKVKSVDPKWRYLWRIGSYPVNSNYTDLNSDNIVPNNTPGFYHTMDEWGKLLLATGETVSEMLSIGLGLEKNTFTDYMVEGPHLLAPTGTDLNEHGKLNNVFAGFHTDLSFLTLHGKCRFPGLHIWTKNGERIEVSVPRGCILIQAGQQLEYLTGGLIKAGYHEVVCDQNTMNTIYWEKGNPRPLWRVSSTMFTHLKSDKMLKPLEPYLNEESEVEYPEIPVGEQVRKELDRVKLL